MRRANMLYLRKAMSRRMWEEDMQGVHRRGGTRRRFLVFGLLPEADQHLKLLEEIALGMKLDDTWHLSFISVEHWAFG